MQPAENLCIPNRKGKKVSKSPHQKTVVRPSAHALIIRNSPPVLRGQGGEVRITHREFVGSYKLNVGGSGWSIVGRPDGYDINPTSSALFPWLAPMAINFERYRFNSLRFKCYSAASTAMTGRVYLTVDYDWDDPLPNSKREFLGNQYTVSGPCWQDLTLTVNPKLVHADMPWKYCRSPSRADPEPRTNYGGFILVGCDAAATSAQFDFWVEYDVTLSTPQFDSVDPEFLTRPEVNTSVLTSPTTPPGGHILQPPLPVSGTSYVRATIPNSPSHAGVTLSNAVDIRKVNAGSLSITTRLSESGVAPSTVLSKMGSVAIVRVFDAIGNALGDFNAGAGTGSSNGVEQLIAPEDPAQLSTPGAYVSWLVTMSPSLIKLAYNAAAYVAILNYGGSPIGAGKISSSIASYLRPI